MDGNLDLYDVLSVPPTATQDEIKKAYRKAALRNHPDKVDESERPAAEIKFKEIQHAYEILMDEDARMRYDRHGTTETGPFVDEDEIFEFMFGFSRQDMNDDDWSTPGGKGKSVHENYKVTLEELYTGKTTKFQSEANVLCTQCQGRGGKDKAKAKKCETCKGTGTTIKIVPIGPGRMGRHEVACSTCNGSGQFYLDKDKCKKCKGAKTIKQKKILEIVIPPGSEDGDIIVLEGEADQEPGDIARGDIVFHLKEELHPVFLREGADLHAEISITLTEALTGLDRVVLKHLDGRGKSIKIQQPNGAVLRPGQVLKFPGDGMPHKDRHGHGDLFLDVSVVFPPSGFFRTDEAVNMIKAALPQVENNNVKMGGVPAAVDELILKEHIQDGRPGVEDDKKDPFMKYSYAKHGGSPRKKP